MITEHWSRERILDKIVCEDPKRLNVPILFVEMENMDESVKVQKTEKLAQIAKEELPEHMRPAEIHILDKMSLTPLGKIDYQGLNNMILA